jgi:uncharacterized protein YhbP (UPF0306 family)
VKDAGTFPARRGDSSVKNGDHERASSARDGALEAILALLREHFVLSLATCGTTGSHSAPLYYVLDEVEGGAPSLVFTSDPGSLHCCQLEENPRVSAAIHLETRDVEALRGVQLHGRCRRMEGEEASRAQEIYVAAFPAAGALLKLRREMRFYRVEMDWAKLTDNRRGFGFKLVWTKG